jgi:hypothetical protein
MRSRLVSRSLIGVLAISLTAIVDNADDRGARDQWQEWDAVSSGRPR